MSYWLLLLLLFGLVIAWLIVSYFVHGCLHTSIPNVSYQITGNEKGKPLVFIHGWPDTPAEWNKQIEHLKEKYLCINVELPNYNIDRVGNPWGYDIPNVVTGIANQIQYLLQSKYSAFQQEGVTLVIHDWGSAIGQFLMRRHPFLVSRAVIVDIGDAAPTKTAKQAVYVLAYQLWNIFCFLLPSSIGNRVMRGYLHKAHSVFFLPTVEMEKHSNGKVILHAGMNYLYFYMYKTMITYALTGRTKELKLPIPKVPTLFICGKWRLGPWHTKKWKQVLTERKDCEFKQYQDAKHWIMHDQCDRFNRDVATWLNQTDALVTK